MSVVSVFSICKGVKLKEERSVNMEELTYLANIIFNAPITKNIVLLIIILLVFQILITQYQFKRYKYRTSGKVRLKYMKRHKGLFGIHICRYCFKPVLYKNVKVDHIFPFSKNGSNKIWNLTAACKRCNHAKKDKVGLWVIRGYIGKILIDYLLVWIVLILYLTRNLWLIYIMSTLSEIAT